MSEARRLGARPPEEDEELIEFLEQAPVGLCWVDPDGRMLWTNRIGLDLLGCSEQESSGRAIAGSFVEPQAAAEILGRLGRGEVVKSYEAGLRAANGAIRRVLVGASNLFREGRLVHSRWVIRDVTGLLEREEAARHRALDAGRLKDEFLALLSHELRTPLGAILVWLGLLRQGGTDPAEATRALEIIERSARTLERIIEDLLHASRIAAGGLMLSPQLRRPQGRRPGRDRRRVARRRRQGSAAHHVSRGGTDLGDGRSGPAPAGRVQPPVERHQVHAGRGPCRGVAGQGGPAGPTPGRRHRRRDERRLPAVRLREVPPAGQHAAPEPTTASGWVSMSSVT